MHLRRISFIGLTMVLAAVVAAEAALVGAHRIRARLVRRAPSRHPLAAAVTRVPTLATPVAGATSRLVA